MAAVIHRCDFSFAELKREVATVFLVLPPDRLDAYARWLRLMVVQALTALARSSARPPLLYPVPAGRVCSARTAAGGGAGSG